MTSRPRDPTHAEIFKNIYVNCKIGKIMEIYEMTLVWIPVGLNKSKLSRVEVWIGVQGISVLIGEILLNTLLDKVFLDTL